MAFNQDPIVEGSVRQKAKLKQQELQRFRVKFGRSINIVNLSLLLQDLAHKSFLTRPEKINSSFPFTLHHLVLNRTIPQRQSLFSLDLSEQVNKRTSDQPAESPGSQLQPGLSPSRGPGRLGRQ